MRIDARRDVIEVRLGARFRAAEAERIAEALGSLGAFSRLTIDFGPVRDCDDAALATLAAVLRHVACGQIALRGLTHHQWRLLTYLGLAPDRRGAVSAPG